MLGIPPPARDSWEATWETTRQAGTIIATVGATAAGAFYIAPVYPAIFGLFVFVLIAVAAGNSHHGSAFSGMGEFLGVTFYTWPKAIAGAIYSPAVLKISALVFGSTIGFGLLVAVVAGYIHHMEREKRIDALLPDAPGGPPRV